MALSVVTGSGGVDPPSEYSGFVKTPVLHASRNWMQKWEELLRGPEPSLWLSSGQTAKEFGVVLKCYFLRLVVKRRYRPE